MEGPAYDTPTLRHPPAANLADPALRVVAGLIDLIMLAVLFGLVEGVTKGSHAGALTVDLLVALAYFGYFWSAHGQTVGQMVFGFRVRDLTTGRFPNVGMAVLRGFIWWLEVVFCCVGAVGWLWMFWDPRRQGFHDKVAGTIVTSAQR